MTPNDQNQSFQEDEVVKPTVPVSNFNSVVSEKQQVPKEEKVFTFEETLDQQEDATDDMNSEQIGKRTTINSIHLSKNSNDMNSMREKYNSITSGGQKSQSSGGV